jgi:hypothetical protein
VLLLNFVEIMALYRAFSVGRFKCSGALPKIGVADLLCDGYVLKVMKNSARTFCLNCIRDFCFRKGFSLAEDADYLTIRSSSENSCLLSEV